jgi:hypothetical protein
VNTSKIVVALSLISLAALAFADDAHHPDEKAQAAPAQPAAKAPAGAMDMSSMQANMKRMQEQMAQIRVASDPKERARLVDEHMKTMQSMSKMHGDGCQGMDMQHEGAQHPSAK